MKKLVLIVGLVLVAASCQKEQIVPRTSGNGTSNTSTIMACPTNEDDTQHPTAGTISSSGGTTVNGDTNAGTLDDDGEITDPMRKKDKKGN